MNILIKATLDAYTSLDKLEKQDINIVNGLPPAPQAVANALYVDTLENQLAITIDNIRWITVYPGFVGDESEGSEDNPDKLVPLKVLKSSLDELHELVDQEIQATWDQFYNSKFILDCGNSIVDSF